MAYEAGSGQIALPSSNKDSGVVKERVKSVSYSQATNKLLLDIDKLQGIKRKKWELIEGEQNGQ